MRVLILSPSFPPATTGEAEHCLQIAMKLAALGRDVTVLTNAQPARAEAPGFTLHATVRGWKWRHLPGLLLKVLRARPDAILIIYTAWLYDDHPMVTVLPALLRRIRPTTRQVLLAEIADSASPGGFLTRAGRKLFGWLLGSRGTDYGFGPMLRDVDRIAVLGPTILSELASRDASVPQRALVIPPPPLLLPPRNWSAAIRAEVRHRLGIERETTFLFAYFGYVYAGKGIETLFEALRLMRSEGRDIRLVMAGGGRAPGGAAPASFEARMVELSHQLGVADIVVWPSGYTSGGQGASEDLMAADAALLPFDDGAELRRSSISVVAAMGLPIVTSFPLEGSRETAFINGQNVLMAPAKDALALCHAAGRVMDEVALHLQLKAGADQLTHDWFSWEGAIKTLDGALARSDGRKS